MVDITLYIALADPPDVLAVETRWKDQVRAGHILDVYPRAEITEPPATNRRLGFVHVTGVPLAAARNVARLLEPYERIEQRELALGRDIAAEDIAAWWDGLEGEPFVGQPILKPGTSNTLIGNAARRIDSREWRIDLAAVPAAIRAQLLATHEVAVTWEQIKTFVNSGKLGRSLTDADLA